MKKKYEPPSITGPESEGKANSGPAGVTGCSVGSFGGKCSNGNEPQGSSASCSIGSNPTVSNCNNGTTAAATCRNGSDAVISCNTGTQVPGDCTDGTTPLGASCAAGTSASSCSGGTSAG